MQCFMKHILRMAATVTLCALLTACIYEEPEEAGPAEKLSLLSLSLSLPMSRADVGADPQYVPGEGYENYIDIKNKGYRIYFFDSADKYVATFVPMLVEAAGSQENTYSVVGKATDEITGLSNFKVVVLANWPSYPADADLQSGVTTIEDLCSAATATFNALSSFDLDAKQLTIPFYGVHHYTGITIEKGKLTTLDKPVALLRAMAKIEVIFDTPGLSLDDVILHGYNKTGYCAPTGIYTQDAYDHNGQWDYDYVQALHLVGGQNDADAVNNTIHLLRKPAADASQPDTWICYVPEYRNTAASGTGPAADKATLELKFDIPDIPLDNMIYFTKYEQNAADGVYRPVAGTDFDLHRNNLYRFHVSVASGRLIINVVKWENAYDNRYIFD